MYRETTFLDLLRQACTLLTLDINSMQQAMGVFTNNDDFFWDLNRNVPV